MEINGRVALVTGGTRGIGRAIVEKLYENEAKVYIIYKKSRDIANYLESKGIVKRAYKVDVSEYSGRRREGVKETIEDIIKREGRIDILINNAGIYGDHDKIEEITEQEFYKIIDVNLKGVFNTVKAAIPYMISQKSGVIVNISSIVGLMGSRVNPVYAASKAAMIGFSLSLAAWYSKYGIRVVVIAPGGVDTDWWKGKEDIKAKIIKKNPMKRLADPYEIAETVIFVIKNDYINACVIPVDGGRLAFREG